MNPQSQDHLVYISYKMWLACGKTPGFSGEGLEPDSIPRWAVEAGFASIRCLSMHAEHFPIFCPFYF